ncbi:TPA: transporter substrate-binding domain-containing protein [Streptococcus equi subsp. zooepidemicus]|uniref:transporter substrate-binding domain-containing protein n=1 Tax=Streptococcus equi TaxID=1336 RepID=UPI000DA2D141|nr:transporter substrate-binding domain-containing protein [Streptococcus equi]MCD3460710.1 transporter substrate-binding domain-containing protein [Streptococcus equi subsp. zooepidemicus]SQG17347.1 putative ABC transporter cystine-binding lipoprotein precursor [Streptococcus equi subsp. zooepidemicus]HEK9980178.1 transporter substrate-binding domain-containing protein [Streptococcus equi subsp. zooepidemicus]HEK9983341.1 transporter substrate-binding domain-containing protein [Streptococcus e
MKKGVALLSVSLASLLLAACGSQPSAQKTSWEKIKDKGVLKVATPATYQPTSYYNDANELVGYEVDLMKEIGKRLDLKVKFIETGYDQAFTSVDSGRVDVSLNNFDITAKRQKKYNISTPYKYGVGGMIVRADGSSGISKADLSDWKGKKAAGASGTEYMKVAKKQGAELVIYDNVTGDVYLNDVANGRTDFIPNDYPAQKLFVDYMKSQNPNLNVKMSDVLYNPTAQGIIMSKKDDTLKKKIDAVIKDMKQDGSLKTISKTYYAGQDLTVPFGKDKKIPVIDTSDVD